MAAFGRKLGTLVSCERSLCTRLILLYMGQINVLSVNVRILILQTLLQVEGKETYLHRQYEDSMGNACPYMQLQSSIDFMIKPGASANKVR